MGGTHSLLSPSAAKRWMRCAASVAASKDVVKPPSKDSALGTAKHAVSEFCLSHFLPTAESFLGQTVEADGFKFKVDREFIEHVDAYLVVVRSETGKQFYEIKLDTSEILHVRDQGGTADCIDLNTESDTLTVIDAKFGYNAIDAQDNEQGLLYLCAARRRYEHVADWKTFRFVIAQPRVSREPDVAVYTLEQIVAFEKRAKAAATAVIRIMALQGDISDMMNPSPEACEWCPIRQNCIGRTRSIAAMFTPIKPPEAPSIENAALAKYLKILDDVEKWCKDIRQESYQRAMSGQEIPGYQLNQKRKGNRYWLEAPEKVAPKLVALGLSHDDLFEPAPLKSPTDIEAICKERKINIAPLKAENEQSLVGQSEGGAVLVEVGTRGKLYILNKPEFAPSMESLV